MKLVDSKVGVSMDTHINEVKISGDEFTLTEGIIAEGKAEGTSPAQRIDTFLSIPEAARRLGVSYKTVSRRIQDGYLEGMSYHGQLYVKVPEDILRHGLPKKVQPKKTARSPWTPYKIKQAIRDMVHNGTPPTWEQAERTHPGLYQAACSSEGFGSWQAALIAADATAAIGGNR